MKAQRGSQHWLQIAVNRKPELLLRALQESGAVNAQSSIDWKSPLKEYDFREYRDGAALEKVRIKTADLKRPLGNFWPARGPVWDALGITSEGHPVFMEAKAHIPEAASPGTRASGKSRKLIKESLRKARSFYAPRATAIWSELFYQYSNRLAHQYFLTRLNAISSTLVFLYFVNARDMQGPRSVEEWQGAIRLIHAILGLPEDLRSHRIFDAFLDAGLLEDASNAN